ncbi:hypothetical protein D3C72_2421940 [compost metagenome]
MEAIPRFFELARDAGVRQAVLVESFYPQVAPELIDSIPYVRSRHLSDQAVRALCSGCAASTRLSWWAPYPA